MIQNFHRSNPLIFQSFDFQHYSFEIGMCPLVPIWARKYNYLHRLIGYDSDFIRINIITET